MFPGQPVPDGLGGADRLCDFISYLHRVFCLAAPEGKEKRRIYSMKFVSWNVNGLRACVTKGFLDFFKEVDADVFCVQETKLQEGQIDLELPGYHQFWN